MSEEFDKQLRGHITDVFDNYEGSSADAGWALLREKYPEKDKKRPFAWWWLGVAAGLLLLSGVAYWFYKNDAVKTGPAPKGVAKVKSLVADTLHRQASPGMPLNAPSNAQDLDKQPGAPVATPAFAGVNGESHTNKQVHSVSANDNINNGRAKITDDMADNNGITRAQANATSVTEIPITTDTAKKQGVVASLQPSVTTKTDSATKSKKTNTLLADKAKPVQQAKRKAVAWSVFASAYNNFASKSTASTNSGAGFGTDIRLSRMFALSTGLGVFRNSIGYNPNSGLLLYAASQAPSTYYSVTNYNADLLALEMPVRLNFNISKQGNYVSAGINSAMFINETYHQTNNYFNSAFGNSGLNSSLSAQPQDVVTEKHFQTFAFAKSFDIAADFGYPLGKNRMVLEPFVKIPLNTLSRPELNYGAVGASIKLTFGAGK